jgi:hypothetical protein
VAVDRHPEVYALDCREVAFPEIRGLVRGKQRVI